MDARNYLNTGDEHSKNRRLELALNAYTLGTKSPDEPNQTSRANCFYRLAHFYQYKEYDLAIINYEEAEKLFTHDTDKIDCHIKIGDCHRALKNDAAAIESYQEVLSMPSANIPQKANCYKKLGLVYQNKNDIESAIQHYTQAIQLFDEMKSIPKNTYPGDCYFHRGAAYQAKGDIPSALKDYGKALGKGNFTSKEIDDYKKGTVYLILKDYQSAYSQLWGIKYDRKKDGYTTQERADRYYNLALAEQGIGDQNSTISGWQAKARATEMYHDAKKHFGKAIKYFSANNDKARAYEAWAMIYDEQKKYKKAIAKFSAAIKLFSDNTEKASCYLSRALIYIKRRDYKHALHDCNEALLQYPDDHIEKAATYFHRGEVYQAENHQALALEDFNEAIKRYPNGHFLKLICCHKKAIALQALGDHKAAINLLDQIIPLIKNKSDQAQCYFDRAKAHQALGNYDSAIQDFTTAIHIDPKSSSLIAEKFDKNQLKFIVEFYPDFYHKTLMPVLSEDQCSYANNIEEKIKKQKIAQSILTEEKASPERTTRFPFFQKPKNPEFYIPLKEPKQSSAYGSIGLTVFSPQPTITHASSETKINTDPVKTSHSKVY